MPKYIDADALLQDMETACNRSQFGRDTAKMCVKRATTADVVPVVRGEWERMTNPYGDLEGFMCACGRTSQSADNYCPNCGAKMESEGGA